MADVSLHPRGLPVTEDEELPEYLPPQYVASQLPTYERASISIPPVNLRFRQIKRSLLTLDSTDERQKLHYKIITKTGPRLFSGRPDMTLFLEVGGNSAPVGTLQFDDSASLPWIPRAKISVDIPGSGSRAIAMESKNFSDWAFSSENTELKWKLQDSPTSLGLIDTSSGICIARFTYSIYGTTATRGAEIGDLAIYTPGAYGLTVEAIICSCSLVIKYWPKMGRHHRKYTTTTGRYTYGSGVTLSAAHTPAESQMARLI